MDRLRGLTRTEELGRRVAAAVFDVAEPMAGDIRTDAPLVHVVRQIDVPARIVTDAEYATAQKVCGEIDAKKNRAGWDTWVYRLYKGVCDRYQEQHNGKRTFALELHVLRLGEVAIATNPFELYVDYGVQIQARSPAEQTFLIQLAAGPWSGYLPTARAAAGGEFTAAPMNNYSATVMTNLVGPEGGQSLVDQTVEALHALWASPGAK